ncbi:MAG: hypothetical protein WBN71_03310 [Acidimicrobiia bacterium]|jgi:hypothetical protein
MQPKQEESTTRIPRHEHRVRTFSRNYGLITGLGDRHAVEPDGARELVRFVTGRFDVVEPDLAFNRRRRPDTGQCWAPRWRAVEQHGESRIQAWERHYQRDYPSDGQIRLGTTTSVRTLAHELAHHLVHVLEPARTPAHGKVWVGRFDDAMELIAECLEAPIPG